MSTNVEGINYGTATILAGLTTPGGLSYVWAWDTTNSYVRFFDGVTSGGRRMAFYSDLPVVAGNLYLSGAAGTLAVASRSNVWFDLSGGAGSMALPAAGNAGNEIFVKDYKSTGYAATHNLTITVAGGGTIDGAASLALAINGQAFTLIDNGTAWSVKA